MLLAQSRNDVKVWETFAGFIAFLLKGNILTYDEFESQCMDFYRKEWDQVGCSFDFFFREYLNSFDFRGLSIILPHFFTNSWIVIGMTVGALTSSPCF